ncbi:MAG: putative toxin-antitoxin system toxin component, PIN family [Tissierellaceae bacterium]
MRIMLDTNVLISVFVFKSKILNKVIETIVLEHRLVLSSFVVDELKQVVDRKFANKLRDLDEFLTVLPYELVYTPEIMDESLFEIRDKMDYPVLYTAIIEDVDILVTGDKDFSEVDVEKPEILTPNEFLEKYVSMIK